VAKKIGWRTLILGLDFHGTSKVVSSSDYIYVDISRKHNVLSTQRVRTGKVDSYPVPSSTYGHIILENYKSRGKSFDNYYICFKHDGGIPQHSKFFILI
jgi:hypothetical protein